MSNLMVSFTTSTSEDRSLSRRSEEEAWLREYIRGTSFELYSHRLPPAFQGLPFQEVRADCIIPIIRTAPQATEDGVTRSSSTEDSRW